MGTSFLAQLLPLPKVAEALSVSIYSVRRYIDAEAIKAVRIGSRVLVSSEEVLRVQRDGVGTPGAR